MLRCGFVCLCLFFCTVTSMVAQASDQLRMARVYEQSGDHRNAARIYLDVYESGTRTPAVFDGITRSLLALQQYSALYPIAEAEFARQPSTTAAMVAAKTAALLGTLSQADHWWNEARRVTSTKDQPGLVAQIARDQESARLYDRAINSYLAARELSGDPTDHALPLADLYGAVGKVAESVDEVLNEYRREGRFVVVAGRISALVSKGASTTVIAQQLDLAGSSPDMLEVQAWFAGEIGAWDRARLLTESLDRQRNAQGRDLLQFANRAKAAGAYDAALVALEVIMDAGGPLALSATYMYTRTLDQRSMEQGRLSASTALDMIERYRAIVTDHPRHPIAADALLRCAELYDQVLHNSGEARSVLTLLTNNWNGTEAAARGRLLLADLYLAIDRPDAAREILSPLLTTSSSRSDALAECSDAAALKLADLDLFAGRESAAMERFTALAANPSSVAANDAIERLGLLMLRADDSLGVARIIRALEASHRRQLDTAIAVYASTARSTRSADVADLCWLSLAILLADSERDAEALVALEAIVGRIPESLVGDRALALIARLHERAGRTDDARSALTTLIVQYPLSILAPAARDQIRRLRAH